MFIALNLAPIIIRFSSKCKNIRLLYNSSKFIKSKPKSRNLPTPLLRDTQRALEIEPGVWMSPLCHDGRLFTLDNCPARSLLAIFENGLKLSNDGPCLGIRDALFNRERFGAGFLIESRKDARPLPPLPPPSSQMPRQAPASAPTPAHPIPPGPLGPYRWLRYSEVHRLAQALGSGLLHVCGIEPGQQSLVGIYASNCIEFTLTDRAALFFNMVPVPVFSSIALDSLLHIIKQTAMSVIFVDNRERLDALLRTLGEQTGPLASRLGSGAVERLALKHVVAIGKDVVNSETRKLCELKGLNLYSFDDLLNSKPDDIYTICYTSGTTGSPKGAMITHRSLIVDMCAFDSSAVPWGTYKLSAEDSHISYLPAAHLYDIATQNMCFLNGSRVGFYSGDLLRLVDDIRELRPSFFATVPRLCNRIYDQIMFRVENSNPIVRTLFHVAINSKDRSLKRGDYWKFDRNTIWDRIVFKRLHALLGGEVLHIVTGSAPIDPKVLNFFRCAFGCHVYEGWGQTETSALSTFNLPGEWLSGHVGVPIQCNAISLGDLPEQGYYARERKGEILVKGENCIKGYYRDEKATKSLIDEKGWLHTGDVGEMLPNGNLRIIDRAKNIFKLSQGEFVAPERTEAIYMRSKWVLNIFVYGDPTRSALISVVVPDHVAVQKWSIENGYGDLNYATLCDPEQRPGEASRPSSPELGREREARERLRATILADLQAIGKESLLKGYEQVKALALVSEEFTTASGILTPTMKIRRQIAKQRFGTQIEETYKKFARESAM